MTVEETANNLLKHFPSVVNDFMMSVAEEVIQNDPEFANKFYIETGRSALESLAEFNRWYVKQIILALRIPKEYF